MMETILVGAVVLGAVCFCLRHARRLRRGEGGCGCGCGKCGQKRRER